MSHGPVPNRPAGGLHLPASRGARATLILAVVLLAGLIGWLIHGGSARSRTLTVTRPPATVYQHTPQGAVAALQGALYQLGSQPPPRPAPGTHPGARQINTSWNLLYRIKSYTPAVAVIETWGVTVAAGYGVPTVTGVTGWQFTDTTVRWRSDRWLALAGAGKLAADGTPPSTHATIEQDHAFAGRLGQFRRFPNAP